ncbi:YgcG family protein [Leptospira fluminis]|uniref:YgcG family protein n=1 Tax=Leptospira fluminis TaxID=2484979 RepID=A0A4V3JE71_9LEPT|nr:TPM domain-containing protein [Leptospira fluminis]TGK15176.1 YgcG family protein [Leptospira fluminis]
MKRVLLFLVLFFCVRSVLSEPIALPELHRRVTDLTGTLRSEEISSLEEKLKNLEERKGSQVAILVLPTTGEETIEQYSIRLAEKWKVGRKSVADGVIFLVAKNDRKMRFEVGRGLEGALPDVLCKRIQIEYVRPLFKEGKYYEGIEIGIEKIIGLIEGEPLPEPTHTTFHETSRGKIGLTGYFLLLVGVGIFVGIFFRRMFSFIKAGAAAGIGYWAGGLLGISFWTMLPILIVFFVILLVLYSTWNSGMGGGSSWGSWGGYGGGSSWGSSSGGDSGWSGGGGDFGGGGSSSDW